KRGAEDTGSTGHADQTASTEDEQPLPGRPRRLDDGHRAIQHDISHETRNETTDS
ncbi:hypothetical protein PV326_001990, partial [Microctonus aethiopoides]